MIEIEEITAADIDHFWKIHIRYLTEDGIVADPEDIEYFQSGECRNLIRSQMERGYDRHHMVFFVEGGNRIGAAQYMTYKSRDGKCFLLDFWIFPEFRNRGKGHEAFQILEKRTRKDGAAYSEINSEKEDSVRFWKSLGFSENGSDEWGDPLFVRL